jgi:hypothetical protein
LNVLTGTATAENLGRLGSADVFVLLDVLEHLSPPALREVLRDAAHELDGVIGHDRLWVPGCRLAGARWRPMTRLNIFGFHRGSFRVGVPRRDAH